jgi:multidrug efflux pump subunit AcrB
LLAAQRTKPEDISLLRVRTPTGQMVPLSAVTTQAEVPVVSSINHADRERAITISGAIAPGSTQAAAIAFVNDTIAKGMPLGYRVVFSGQSSTFQDSMSSLVSALILGIIVAYMVLASQFNSFLHPVTVLTILPLSVAGAFFALLILGKTLNVFSMIGLLLLMGIVKKNSIILVDYAAQQRESRGLDARAAMQEAGPVRLRPILMTSVATMMSAVPSSLGLGPGSETRAPMADAVLGGLILSTALSLLVVPAFYVVADAVKRKVFRAKPEEGEGAEAHVAAEKPAE